MRALMHMIQGLDGLEGIRAPAGIFDRARRLTSRPSLHAASTSHTAPAERHGAHDEARKAEHGPITGHRAHRGRLSCGGFFRAGAGMGRVTSVASSTATAAPTRGRGRTPQAVRPDACVPRTLGAAVLNVNHCGAPPVSWPG